MRILITLLLALTCVAQEKAAMLTGTVVDATGARITTAKVQFEGPFNATKAVAVDKAGTFTFRDLTPGIYHLQISAPGFLSQQIRDIQLGPGEQRTLAVITLRVGPVPECRAQICL
jgi:uncharacterized membrane protein